MTDWPISQARISRLDLRRFAPDPNGKMATVAAVDRECSDFVAWTDDRPGQWLWLDDPLGNPVLNREHLARAEFMGEAALLFSSPAAWLSAGCRGAVILAWSAYFPCELAGVPRLVVDSPELVVMLSAWFRPKMPETRVIPNQVEISTPVAA